MRWMFPFVFKDCVRSESTPKREVTQELEQVVPLPCRASEACPKEEPGQCVMPFLREPNHPAV